MPAKSIESAKTKMVNRWRSTDEVKVKSDERR